MDYTPYEISPIQHMMSTDRPKLFTDPGFSPWAYNGRVDINSFMKRWGYSQYRSLGANAEVLAVAIFQTGAGTSQTIYLTNQDAIKLETTTGKTFSYITDTGDYNGSIASIENATVTFKNSTVADTEDIAVGDKFILSVDHTADEEPDANWAQISAANTSANYFTDLTLTANYSGTTGNWAGAEKDCLIRRVYNATRYERWNYAIVDDKFCFTNGTTNAQKYTGTGYCTAIDTTYATKAKYCIDYADRLILGNLYVTGNFAPYTFRGSKIMDPTNWTDSSAFAVDLLDTEDYLSGLAKVGPNLVAFKPDSYSIWYRTADQANPIKRSSWKLGFGVPAPYSLVQVKGTCAWVGRDDFYIMNGDEAQSIGRRMKNLFFAQADLSSVWGGVNYLLQEIMWVADTLDYGKLAFVWNWTYDEWYVYAFPDDILCLGRGVI